MTDEQPNDPTRPDSEPGQVMPAPPPETAAISSAADPQREVNSLTAEEQMALFEKELKENDWGHQPC